MSTHKALLLSTLFVLAATSAASALTFTWDPEPSTDTTQTPAQYEMIMTRLSKGAMTQQTEPLTLLDQGTCQAIYDQAGEPAFNAETSHCATVTCPGPGAYTALLHVAGQVPSAKDVNNSSSFGLDDQCKLMSYEDALMANLPPDQAKPSTGTTGTKPDTQVADGTTPDQTDTTKPDSTTDTTDQASGDTTKPTGSTNTGSTHVASLPAPRVLDADAPTTTGTPGSGTTQPGATGTDSSTSGTPSTGNPSTGSTSSPGTTTGSPSSGTTTGSTSGSTGSPRAGTTAGNPATPTSTPLPAPVDAIVKNLQQISSDYDKARKALADKYQKDLTAALKTGGLQAKVSMSQIYAKAIQDDTKLFQDTLKKWDDTYAKLPQQGAPGSGGTGTTPGTTPSSGTPVAGGTTPSTTGSTTASSNGTSAPGTSGMSNDPALTQTADAGDSGTGRSRSSSSSVSGTQNGQPFTGMPRETHGITTITVNGAQQPSASGTDGTTVKDNASKASTASDSQTARVMQ